MNTKICTYSVCRRVVRHQFSTVSLQKPRHQIWGIWGGGVVWRSNCNTITANVHWCCDFFGQQQIYRSIDEHSPTNFSDSVLGTIFYLWGVVFWQGFGFFKQRTHGHTYINSRHFHFGSFSLFCHPHPFFWCSLHTNPSLSCRPQNYLLSIALVSRRKFLSCRLGSNDTRSK